jgi:hypothetical protein
VCLDSEKMQGLFFFPEIKRKSLITTGVSSLDCRHFVVLFCFFLNLSPLSVHCLECHRIGYSVGDLAVVNENPLPELSVAIHSDENTSLKVCAV